MSSARDIQNMNKTRSNKGRTLLKVTGGPVCCLQSRSNLDHKMKMLDPAALVLQFLSLIVSHVIVENPSSHT